MKTKDIKPFIAFDFDDVSTKATIGFGLLLIAFFLAYIAFLK